MNETSTKGKIKWEIITNIISIVLSPIAIIISFYLGATLNEPDVEIKDIISEYDVQEDHQPSLFEIPKKYVAPLLSDLSLMELLQKTLPPEFMAGQGTISLLKQGKIKEGDLNSMQNSLEVTRVILNKNRDEISKNRITIIDSITKFIASISTNSNVLKDDEKRTGLIILGIETINKGQTDDVIFPEGEIKFLEDEIKIINTKEPGYIPITAHSFQELEFKVDTMKSTAKSLKNWKTIVKNNSLLEYTVIIHTGAKNILFKTRLQPE